AEKAQASQEDAEKVPAPQENAEKAQASQENAEKAPVQENAEQAPAKESTEKPQATDALYEARAATDPSFSGRTAIWRNLMKRWKENPKYLLIGHGVGRVGQLVTEGTIHEGRESVSIHNAYLQFTADYGLIAFALLCAFFALIAAPVLRVYAARGAARRPGYDALCGIVAASLMTGMMESAPLGAMTPMNMMLFFSLALLFARGRDAKNEG
ncbi:MAG: O-antigen ligase family protein, partial [Candidatus Ventricola sp.]